MSESSTTVVRGACPHDCPDRCAWRVGVRDGRAVSFEADSSHPFTGGGLCAKVNRFVEDRVYAPDRLLHPLRRVGKKGEAAFERVSWEDALADVASRLNHIRKTSGGSAILPYSFAGTQGMIQAASLDRRFFARIGATNLVRGICGSAGAAGVSATLGTSVGALPEDIVHSRYVILWGTNTVVTNLHLWPFVLEARSRGARIVVVDPVRTRTAAQADWHLAPIPGTDAALALGMMHVIFRDALEDRDYLDRATVGQAELRARAAEYPPDRVASITGLAAADIETLAREYAAAQPSTIRTLIGMEHRQNGAMALRTVAALPALTGAWRHRGGGLVHLTAGLFTAAALNVRGVQMPELVDSSIRSINMVQLGAALEDRTLDPPIEALIVYNSNPMATTPNQQSVRRGLEREDLFTVVLEQFMTDTARYADYVFPATTQIEHADLMWSWGHVDLMLNLPAIAPVGEAAANTDFFRRLALAMGLDEPWLQTSDEELIRIALDSDHPYLRGITYERLAAEGWVRLALPEPWMPFAEGIFPTPSGRCELYSAAWEEAGLDPLPSWTLARPDSSGVHPLHLVSPKTTLHFLNSSYANLPRHLRASGEPMISIHETDARERGLVDGATARVFNERGALTLKVRTTTDVRPGVVSIPSGWWPSLSAGGASVNALTPDGLSDAGGGGDFHDTWVEVERAPEAKASDH